MAEYNISSMTYLGNTYNFLDSGAPKASKTYTNVIATSNDNAGGGFFCIRFKAATYNDMWRIKYRVRATVPGYVEYNTETICEVNGTNSTYRSYYCWNNIKNTSYRPVYYNSIFFASSTGYTNGMYHYCGFNLYNSTNATSTSYKRTIVVDILETEGCTAELLDSLVTPTNIPDRSSHTDWYSSAYNSYTNFNACDQGLKQTGDANSTSISNLFYAYGACIAKSALYRYQLLFFTDENTLTPLNNSNNVTATSKTMLTDVDFDVFRDILYYNSTTAVSANAAIGASTLFYSYGSLVDLRYSLNTGTTLTGNKPFYLVVTPQSNGMVRLASSTPWAQSLPSTNDGNWYVLLGRTYDTYRIALYPFKPVFKHDGTSVVRVLPKTQTAYSNPASSGTEISFIDSISQDEYGKISATKKTVQEVTTSNAGLMGSSDKIKLNGIETGANNYSLPVATSSVLGGAKIGFSQSGKKYPVQLSSEKMYVEVPWTDTTYTTATSSANGLMSATDKSKLDSMTTVPLASGCNITEGTDGLIITYVT